MIKKLTYREFILMFLIFLKEEHAYKEWKKETISQNSHIKQTFENKINPLTIIEGCLIDKENKTYKNVEEIINYSFVWDCTKQRHKFWQKIHQKWKEKFKDIEKLVIIEENIK